MTNPNTDAFGPVRIKTEVLDDEYEDGSHLPPGGQSPTFMVYIDNAHAMASPCPEKRAYIKEETEDFEFDTTLHNNTGSLDDVPEDNIVNNDEDNSEDDTEDDTRTPNSLQSSLGWKIVQTFNLGSAAMFVDSADAGDRFDSIDRNYSESSLGSRTTTKDINRKSVYKTTLLDTAVKEEIHDEEYDKAIRPVNSNGESASENETSSANEEIPVPVKEEEIPIPVKEEENDCEPMDRDRLSGACVDEDRDISSTVNREEDAHGSVLFTPSGVVGTSQRTAADNFQKEFEDYVTGRYITTMINAAAEEEDTNRSPCQLAKDEKPIGNQVTFTLCKPSQSLSHTDSEDNMTVQHKACQEGRQSSSVRKRGKKTQTRKPVPCKVYTCVVCSTEFEYHKDLKAHSRVHKKKYRRYSKLLKMMKSKSSTGLSDLFECRYCNKSFTFAADLTKHMKKHKDERWYYQLLLKYHISGDPDKNFDRLAWKPNPTLDKQHKGQPDNTGDKSHTCMVCGSVFPTEVALQIHMHHPERPLIVENPTLLATETSNPKLTLDGQKQSVHLSKPQFSLERGKPVQGPMNRTKGSCEGDDGSGKTVDDGEGGNGAGAVLKAHLPGSPKLCHHAAVDADKEQRAHESFTQIRKKKDTAKKAPRMSPLATVWNDMEKTVRQSPVCKDRHKHTKKHSASVDCKQKKQRSFADSGCPSLKQRYRSSETIESPHTQHSHTTTTANSRGKPVLDDKTVTDDSLDRQIFFHRGSNSESQPAVVRSVPHSTEPCFTNKRAVYQPRKCKSFKICEEHSADKSAFSRPFIRERSLPGDPYPTGAPRLCPHWCGHLRSAEENKGDCEDVADACNAVSACRSCHRKTFSSLQHPEESRCDDESVSNRTVCASPVTNACPACDTSFQPRRDFSAGEPDQQANSANVTEGKDSATALAKLSHLNRAFRHSHTRRLFTCRYCTSAFDTPQGLSAHQRVHIKVMPYDCNQCTERFQTNEDLQTHNKVHSDSNPFLCVFCNALFPTVKGLRIHLTRNERENIATHFCEDGGKNPVPFLARVQGSVPVMSSVNCSSQLRSALLTSPASSSEITSLKTKPNPISYVHVASISEVTAGSSFDGSSEAYHRSSALMAPQRRSCMSMPSDQATGGSPAAVNSASEETSPDEQTFFKQATDENWCSSVQDRKKRHRNSQPTCWCKRKYALPEKPSSCDHGKAMKPGSTCISKHQATYHDDVGSTHSASTGSKSDDVATHCDFCAEPSCRTLVLTKKKRANFQADATVTQTQAADTAYLCVECQLAFPNKVSLDSHLGIDPTLSYLTCSVCAQTFVCYTALQKHVKEHFSGHGSCASLFQSPLDLSTRRTKVSRQNTRDSPARTYLSKQSTCHLCGRVFADGRGMWKHQKSHLQNKGRNGTRTTMTKDANKTNKRGKLGKGANGH